MNKIFSWDWKEQPDLYDIFTAVEEFLDKSIRPYFYSINTESDEYGFLISDKSNLSDKQTTKLYKERYESDEEIEDEE